MLTVNQLLKGARTRNLPLEKSRTTKLKDSPFARGICLKVTAFTDMCCFSTGYWYQSVPHYLLGLEDLESKHFSSSTSHVHIPTQVLCIRKCPREFVMAHDHAVP
jgi:hypothetical protein